VFPADYLPMPNPSEQLARGARLRREIFASRQEAHANYASKPPLNVLDPEVLAAYVEFGFEDLADAPFGSYAGVRTRHAYTKAACAIQPSRASPVSTARWLLPAAL